MDANTATVAKPSQRLSVATTIAEDAFPDFSDPTLFSGDRSRGAGSLMDSTPDPCESISPVSVSSSTNSPIMAGEQHASLSGGKLMLPIPTSSGNSSQSSFAMSEVDESEGSGFENLPPEVATADISISGASSFRDLHFEVLLNSSLVFLGAFSAHSGWQLCRDDIRGCCSRAEKTIRPASRREQGRAIPVHNHRAHQSARTAGV